jgi:hypothetical protein
MGISIKLPRQHLGLLSHGRDERLEGEVQLI